MAEISVFPVTGTVTDIARKDGDDWVMAKLILDGHFHCAAFGRVAEAVFEQEEALKDSPEVSLLVEVGKKGPYLNYTVLHFHVPPVVTGGKKK